MKLFNTCMARNDRNCEDDLMRPKRLGLVDVIVRASASKADGFVRRVPRAILSPDELVRVTYMVEAAFQTAHGEKATDSLTVL